MCVYLPPEWSYGLESLIWLKYNIYRNGKKYIPFRAQRCQKPFKQKLFGIAFYPKNSLTAYVYLSPEWS